MLLIIIAFVFYWFSVRPENIRKTCNQEARDESIRTFNIEDEPDRDRREALQYKAQENYYASCLRRNGLSQ